jgi:hypothetical protein
VVRPGSRAVLVLLLAAAPPPAAVQREATQPDSTTRQPVALIIGPATEPTRLLRRAAARIIPVSSATLRDRLHLEVPRQRDRVGHAVVGGVIGGLAGLLVCTGISNLVKDEGTGFSTCTTSGYVALGLGGIVVGAGIGALIK